MVLRECCGLEVERETELQVEVERMLVTDCVEWHGCDVMRELGCDVDAHIASEVILRSRSCVDIDDFDDLFAPVSLRSEYSESVMLYTSDELKNQFGLVDGDQIVAISFPGYNAIA